MEPFKSNLDTIFEPNHFASCRPRGEPVAVFDSPFPDIESVHAFVDRHHLNDLTFLSVEEMKAHVNACLKEEESLKQEGIADIKEPQCHSCKKAAYVRRSTIEGIPLGVAIYCSVYQQLVHARLVIRIKPCKDYAWTDELKWMHCGTCLYFENTPNALLPCYCHFSNFAFMPSNFIPCTDYVPDHEA